MGGPGGRERDDLDHTREFQAHLEHEIEENLARGMLPADARRAAHLKFGNRTRIREDVYERGGAVAGALSLARLIRGLLFGVSAFDPATFAGMAALLLAVTLAACAIPVRGRCEWIQWSRYGRTS
jgi:hypothetical protein